MTRLLAAEALKLRTTWGFWIYLGLLPILTALVVAATIGSGVEGFDDAAWRELLQAPTLLLGFLFPLLVGTIAVTSEFRHGTIGQSLLVTPRRGVLLAVKLVAAGLVGLLFAAVSYGLTLAIALPWLGAKDVGVGLGDEAVRENALGVALAFVLLAMFGAGVGGALRSQVGAPIVLVVWFVVVEALVGALLAVLDVGGVARFFPFRATAAVLGVDGDDGEVLSQAAGALVLAAWVAAAAGAAALSFRRDVT